MIISVVILVQGRRDAVLTSLLARGRERMFSESLFRKAFQRVVELE